MELYLTTQEKINSSKLIASVFQNVSLRNEWASHGMGENICNPCVQRTCIYNIQGIVIAQ